MTAPLRCGIALPNYGALASAGNLLRLARRAEARGIDSVWVSDHLVAPLHVGSLYPYDKRPDPKPGMGVIEELYEPLTTLAFVAGATERIRLGVSVYVMPYRNPVVTAKTVATLDALSGGRVIFGVGVGWLREEFAALGQDPRSRGRTTDEYLEVCRRLWRDDLAHAGRDPAGFTVSVRTGILVREEGGGEERPLQETLGKIRRDASAYAAAGVGYLVVNLLHSRSIEALENALDAAADALNS